MTLKDPAQGVRDNLTLVDQHNTAVAGDNPIDFVQGHMAVAQVHATCALVHAVRELTAEVRKLSQTGGGS